MEDMEPKDVFVPGQTVGEYRIISRLGKGGMAEVYEAESIKTGSPYALKVFACEQANAIFLKERFLAEGRLLAKLHHPRIVRVFDFGLYEDRPYFVMDLILDVADRPRTLRDALESGDVDEERIARWYGDLAEALCYIHGKGIVHRDVSLENVMVGPDGRAVLSDFGVSKILDRDLRAELNISLMTQVSDGRPVMGKSFYLAPEVRSGGDETPASDLYALGILVFYLLNQVWYTPGARMADMLAPFDEQWRDILRSLLAEEPSLRTCRPWSDTVQDGDGAKLQEASRRLEASRTHMRRWQIAFVALAAVAATLAVGLAARTRSTVHASRPSIRSKAEKDANVFCTLPASARRDEASVTVRPLVVKTVADGLERESLGIDAGCGERMDLMALKYGELDGEDVRQAIRLLMLQATFRVYLRDRDFKQAAEVLKDIYDDNDSWAEDLLNGMSTLLPDPGDRSAFLAAWRAARNE